MRLKRFSAFITYVNTCQSLLTDTEKLRKIIVEKLNDERNDTMRYDVAVIGTGPGGISAAITLRIRNKSVLFLGNPHFSDKLSRAHEIHNYPGLPAVSGKELAERFEAHLKSLDISITDEQVTAVYAMDQYFAIQTKSSRMYEADSVILATGVSAAKPYPGEEKYLGRGVSYCATCDAPLYRDKTVAVIGSCREDEKEADFLSEIAGKVYYIPLYDEKPEFQHDVTVCRHMPVSISGSLKADKLVLDDRTLEVDGIFILRDSIRPQNLVPGLKLEEGHVVVDRKMQTNLAGCFACGDITGTPYQYIKAAGEGNVAALSAVSYLAGRKR